MDEYIERKKAIDIFIEGDGNNEFTEGYNFAVNEYREKIKAMPAADVQPVKRGKMVAMTDEEKFRAYKETARDYDGRCSLCNACVYNTDIFCAECGADMRGDTNEND